MKLEIRLELNIWGLYCMIGAICAFAAIYIYCRSQGMKKGSAPVIGLTSVILGIICSRGLYCLVMTFTQVRLPLSSWFLVEEGGWSMFGMIGGVMLAGRISALIIGEKPRKTLDAVSLAIPLFIAAERIGEGSLQPFFEEAQEKFNLSRQITGGGFLTITNQGKTYVATYWLCAICAMILFLVLTFSILNRKRRDGDIWICFLMLCGTGGVLMESLRYDEYLVYSFVRIQQILAALMFLWGIILAMQGAGPKNRLLVIISAVAFVIAVGVCILNEYRLDRTKMSHILMHAEMTAVMIVPVILGYILLWKGREEQWGTK